MGAAPHKKKIDGKIYTFEDGSRLKSYSERRATTLRSKGISARVVENPSGMLRWSVYTRRKK